MGGSLNTVLTYLFQNLDPFNPWKMHSNQYNDEFHILLDLSFSSISCGFLAPPFAVTVTQQPSVQPEFLVPSLAMAWGECCPANGFLSPGPLTFLPIQIGVQKVPCNLQAKVRRDQPCHLYPD